MHTQFGYKPLIHVARGSAGRINFDKKECSKRGSVILSSGNSISPLRVKKRNHLRI